MNNACNGRDSFRSGFPNELRSARPDMQCTMYLPWALGTKAMKRRRAAALALIFV